MALLGGADDAVELQRVARLAAACRDLAYIGLVGAGAMDAIGRLVGKGRRHRPARQAGSNGRMQQRSLAKLPKHAGVSLSRLPSSLAQGLWRKRAKTGI